ncbi:hypothetical protein D3C72_2161710 [compost metagenome]
MWCQLYLVHTGQMPCPHGFRNTTNDGRIGLNNIYSPYLQKIVYIKTGKLTFAGGNGYVCGSSHFCCSFPVVWTNGLFKPIDITVFHPTAKLLRLGYTECAMRINH